MKVSTVKQGYCPTLGTDTLASLKHKTDLHRGVRIQSTKIQTVFMTNMQLAKALSSLLAACLTYWRDKGLYDPPSN